MPQVKTHDGVIGYDVHGSGPPLVILRGLARSVSHWLGYEKQLAEHFQVITMDLRGVGKTTRAWGYGTSIYHAADDVAAVLDDLKIDKAHILGVSLGGMVTLAAGIRHPTRCASLVVVNSSIAGTFSMRLTPAAAKLIIASAVRPRPGTHRKFVDLLVGGDCPEDRRAEVAEAYKAIADAETMYGMTAFRQLLAAGRFVPMRSLAKLTVPTLVVYGTDDRFVPTVNSRKIATYIPHAKVVPIHGGGHELTLDKGDELRAVVADWVAACGRR